MESYENGTFIFMDKEMEENVRSMSEKELDMFSKILAANLNKTIREINNDFLK